MTDYIGWIKMFNNIHPFRIKALYNVSETPQNTMEINSNAILVQP